MTTKLWVLCCPYCGQEDKIEEIEEGELECNSCYGEFDIQCANYRLMEVTNESINK